MDLADKIAIENLIHRYARLVDCARYEELGQMFAAGEITANKRSADSGASEPLRGAAAVQRFYATTNKTYPDGSAQTHHVVTNLEFDTRAADEIGVRSCFTVFQGTAQLPLQPIVCGRYADVFRRGPGGWAYRSKHIEVTLVGDISNHLNITL